MGQPAERVLPFVCLWRVRRGRLFLFEDEVGSDGAGWDLDPMRDTGGDVYDVSRVEDDLFSAVDAGAKSFAGAAGAVVGEFALHGAAGDEGYFSCFDDHLIGEELVTLGFAGAGADYEEGVVVAVVFEPAYREAVGACLSGFDESGFALLEVRFGVDDGFGGLGEGGRCSEEREGQDDARKHSDSLADCQIVAGALLGSEDGKNLLHPQDQPLRCNKVGVFFFHQSSRIRSPRKTNTED
jgi:hypothetical protein